MQEIANNTLIIVGDSGEQSEVLYCSTNRGDCCNSDKLHFTGNWFLPNGSKILSSTGARSLSLTLGNQTVGLNVSNDPDLPIGIYHCEMMDRNNVTHYLYAGIYPEHEGTCYYCNTILSNPKMHGSSIMT